MMIDYLESVDRLVVLTVNSWNTPFLDELMWIVSAKTTWIPFYILLVYLFARNNNLKKTIFYFLAALLVVALADQLSVHLFKNMFLRYRPSHNELLTEKLHLYQFPNGDYYKGGMYGFVSSHAANFFGVCVFAGLVLKKYYPKIISIIIIVAVLVSFSRIYLGVHYLSDLIGGAILGSILAFSAYHILFIANIDKEYFK